MGSLVPGWDTPKHEPDFREMSKPQDEEVPEWLQRVRSTDSDRDARLHRAMDAAQRGLNRPSLTRTSLSSSHGGAGSPPQSVHLADASGRNSVNLKRTSVSKEACNNHEDLLKSKPEEHIDWWRRVDSAYGNAKPDAERPENWRTGNYVPQYTEAKQHLKHDP